MRLNLKFHEDHAWVGDELFIRTDMEKVDDALGNEPVCWLSSDEMDKIEDRKKASSVFLCVDDGPKMELYAVTCGIVHAGGDCQLFLKRMATFH